MRYFNFWHTACTYSHDVQHDRKSGREPIHYAPTRRARPQPAQMPQGQVTRPLSRGDARAHCCLVILSALLAAALPLFSS